MIEVFVVVVVVVVALPVMSDEGDRVVDIVFRE